MLLGSLLYIEVLPTYTFLSTPLLVYRNRSCSVLSRSLILRLFLYPIACLVVCILAHSTLTLNYLHNCTTSATTILTFQIIIVALGSLKVLLAFNSPVILLGKPTVLVGVRNWILTLLIKIAPVHGPVAFGAIVYNSLPCRNLANWVKVSTQKIY